MKTKIASLLLLMLFFSCKKEVKEKNTQQQSIIFSDDFQLKAGDILFQDSDCGPFCESIEKVTFGIYGSKFSHAGIVVEDENEQLKVLEAISAGVVETSLDSFFNRSFDEKNRSKVAVGRLKKQYNSLIPSAIAFAKTKIGASYDEVFAIENDKYYCSELIYFSFQYANNNQPIFELQKMTFKDPETNEIFPIWADYFKNLEVEIPEGKPGLNPGGMSKSSYIDVVHFYGKPQGFDEKAYLKN